jgi:hypothetical protein
VFFILKRSGWGYDDLYEAIKTGKKDSEWRDDTDTEHWRKRLLNEIGLKQLKWAYELKERNKGNVKPHFLLPFADYMWKHKKVRFRVGRTKSPTLIADIKDILYHSRSRQFEILIENVKEVKN